jgi:hypothetical protein
LVAGIRDRGVHRGDANLRTDQEAGSQQCYSMTGLHESISMRFNEVWRRHWNTGHVEFVT